MSLHDFSSMIGEYPLSSHKVSRTISLMKSEVTSDSILSYIKLALTDPKKIDFIATSAYVHQLGFEKYTLPIDFGSNIKLRLHVWREAVESPYLEDIHNHRHDFISKILAGSLEHHIFEQSESMGKIYEVYSYRYDDATQISTQNFFCTCRAKEVSQFVVSSGDVYYFKNDTLHKVYASTPITITALLQGDCINNNVMILKAKKIHQATIESRGVRGITYIDAIANIERLSQILKARK